MRSVVVNYNGRKYSFPIGLKNEQEAVKELQEQLRWSEKLLMYCCYVNCEVASTVISECFEVFYTRPDVFKHKIKRLAKEARKELNDTINIILRYGNRQLFENYSTNFCIDVEADCKAFRDSLKEELEAHNVKEAELYAHVNTSLVLLEYCINSYDTLMKELRGKFGRDFSPLYTMFCPKSALLKWNMMFTELFEKDKQESDVNLSECVKCQEALKAIDTKLLDYDRIEKNITAAYNELVEEEEEKKRKQKA